MFITQIKQNLEKLQISYPPCKYQIIPNKPLAVKYIGFTGPKREIDPLHDSICLIIKSNYDEKLLNDIYQSIVCDISNEEGDLPVVEKLNSNDTFTLLNTEYMELERRLKEYLPININEENLDSIEKIKRKLDEISEIKKKMYKIEINMKSCQPHIKLYCRKGTLIYDFIKRNLYDLIKC